MKHRRIWGLALTVVVATGCAPVQRDVIREASNALPPARDTPSARYVQAEPHSTSPD